MLNLRIFSVFFSLVFFELYLHAQQQDTIKKDWLSIHIQATVINQFKPGFKAKYTGDNSLSTQQENQVSITSTLYAGVRLWKGGSIYVNPEIAGGSGLSQVLGLAAATNGETFRIGNPSPKIYVARLFYRQLFALTKEKEAQSSDFNQIGGNIPAKYIALTIGKIGAADYFDKNTYSHDPRTQFMCWALMSNGAWDYPANTRGYTPSVALEYVSYKHEVRYQMSLVPLLANGNVMNWDVSKSSSHVLEYTHNHQIHNQVGVFRFLAFYTTTHMGNYRQSLALNPVNPDISLTRIYGRSKFGFAVNFEQQLIDGFGCFARASWNDGKNETWAFTEIDQSISAGLSLTGKFWKRPSDVLGLAFVTSGISKDHRAYLKAGGKGFMLGDGNINYGWEHLAELYYAINLFKQHIFITGAYQFILNPGYNKDRQGPISVLSVRLHAQF